MIFVCHEKKFPGAAPGVDPQEYKINDKCIEQMLRKFMQTLTGRLHRYTKRATQINRATLNHSNANNACSLLLTKNCISLHLKDENKC